MQIKPRVWDGKPITEPGVYANVPADVYHGADLCAGPSISSSGLRTIFTQSPMHYWVTSALNPRRIEQEEKEHFILGRAAHHLILGEKDFRKHFTFEPETYPDSKTGEPKKWNNNATFCREWHEHVAAEGLTVLTTKQLECIRGMAGLLPWQVGLEDSGLRNCALVRAGALEGLIEHTIIAKDPETGVYLKARPDVIPLDAPIFSDFKTTKDVARPALVKTLDDLRYDMQAHLASFCLELAEGFPFDAFPFVFAAKTAPHATAVIELHPKDLGEAAQDNRTAIRTFARCLETGRWPGPNGTQSDSSFVHRSEGSRDRASKRRAFLEQDLAA